MWLGTAALGAGSFVLVVDDSMRTLFARGGQLSPSLESDERLLFESLSELDAAGGLGGGRLRREAGHRSGARVRSDLEAGAGAISSRPCSATAASLAAAHLSYSSGSIIFPIEITLTHNRHYGCPWTLALREVFLRSFMSCSTAFWGTYIHVFVYS